MSRTIYSEKQYYLTKSDYHWALAIEGGLAIMLFTQLLFGSNARSPEPLSLAILLAALALVAGVLWFLHRLSLKVTVNKKGIYFKMKPFHLKKKKLKWEDLAECRLVEDPHNITWNYGRGISWQEKKFTFNGRQGLSLITQDGERIFIGSRNLDQLKSAIDQGFKKYSGNK